MSQEAPPATLARGALLLGAANTFDQAMQFVLPMLLARCLDTTEFGQYRLLWLVAGAVMSLAPLAMPASLFWFWPRADAATRRLYVWQTLLFLAAAGTLAAALLAPWNPLLPANLRDIGPDAAVVPAFIALYVVASMLDMLPTVDERIGWQAGAMVGLAVVRTLVVGITAAVTQALPPVLLALLGFVVLKLLLLLGYVLVKHGLGPPFVRWPALAGQLRYAAPFGATGALYGLRVQVDQWIVAAMFSVATFASFSIAAVTGPLLHLFRQSVNNIVLPGMSRCEARGDIAGMLALNSRANLLVAAVVGPLFAFLFVFADEVVTLIYTATYVDAAPVMRVYLIGFIALFVELATVTLVLREGAFVLRLNLAVLALCVLLAGAGAWLAGPIGAAWGSVITLWIDRTLTLRHIARRSGVGLQRLQDWRGLAVALLRAFAAGAVAWVVVFPGLGVEGIAARAALGAALVAGVSLALHAASRRPAPGSLPAATPPS